MVTNSDLLKQATQVLKDNDRGTYTQPAKGLYPHQWLWDSCFTAIGLAQLDVKRAQTELHSLLRGQWHNGMLPNIIFSDEAAYRTDRNLWRSWLNPNSPDNLTTTGITQPPLLAEAVVRIGKKLDWPERRLWYRRMYQPLVDYHEWLYRDRDPHGEGLVLLVHPWEAGLDNSPPWINEMHDHQMSLWVRAAERLHVDRVVNIFRRDTRSVPLDQRLSTIEALALFDIQLRLRRKAFDINRILDHSMFTIEDLPFNAMLVRANAHLRDIAHTLREPLSSELLISMHKTEAALESLWDEPDQAYYSRDFITHRLIKVASIATLLPLYAGTISKAKAAVLVKKIEDEHQFGPSYPLPSVPLNSDWFHRKLYWQGPTWINMNWLIIDGLERYGYSDHAAALRESSLEMVGKSGFAEYFDAISGEPAGGAQFSWTAALIIDMITAHSKL
jgi:hypothetical protein